MCVTEREGVQVRCEWGRGCAHGCVSGEREGVQVSVGVREREGVQVTACVSVGEGGGASESLWE